MPPARRRTRDIARPRVSRPSARPAPATALGSPPAEVYPTASPPPRWVQRAGAARGKAARRQPKGSQGAPTVQRTLEGYFRVTHDLGYPLRLHPFRGPSGPCRNPWPVCIYIYIYIERERALEIYIYIYIY